MIADPKTVKEAVDRLGGNEAVAALCGVSASAVRNWLVAKLFPAAVFRIITEALSDINLSIAIDLFDWRKPSDLRAAKQEGCPARA